MNVAPTSNQSFAEREITIQYSPKSPLSKQRTNGITSQASLISAMQHSQSREALLPKLGTGLNMSTSIESPTNNIMSARGQLRVAKNLKSPDRKKRTDQSNTISASNSGVTFQQLRLQQQKKKQQVTRKRSQRSLFNNDDRAYDMISSSGSADEKELNNSLESISFIKGKIEKSNMRKNVTLDDTESVTQQIMDLASARESGL